MSYKDPAQKLAASRRWYAKKKAKLGLAAPVPRTEPVIRVIKPREPQPPIPINQDGYGVQCPSCGSFDFSTIDSRASKRMATVRRRKKCFNCDGRITTYEVAEQFLNELVMENEKNKRRVATLKSAFEIMRNG